MASYALGERLHDGRTTVYRAVRESDLQPVVLKVLDAASRPRELARLEHEFELGRALDTPAVVKALALDALNGRPVLVLEDVGGESLDRLLKASGALPVGRFLPLAVRIARAVASLHDLHVVHRDLKPENMLVTPGGAVHLVDLGLASRLSREESDARSARTIEGTFPYISPEQTGRMGRPIDNRSDLYSLGVTFFQLLTGRLPFEATDPLGWVHCHIARRPPAPSDLVPSIPRPLSDLVLKLLAKVPEDRYQSARGLAHDLSLLLEAWTERGELPALTLGARDWSESLRIPRRLYGRETENAMLHAAFARVAATGAPEFVLVGGYSGVGKSSLIQELHKPIAGHRGFFASGKFEQFLRDVPHRTVVRACRELVLEVLAESEERIADWGRAVAQALGPNVALLTALVPELRGLLGDRSAASDAPPPDSEQRLFVAIQQFLSVFAQASHPVTLFLDDLQWADAASLRLLRHVLVDAKVPYLLVIGAYRDNEVPVGHALYRLRDEVRDGGTSVLMLELKPLGAEHLGRLIADAIRASPERAAPLAQLVEAKTGGNPFFAKHYLTALERRGLLALDRETGDWGWDAERIADDGFTDNVVELLVRKVRLLPEVAREALRLCACIGNVVSEDTLALMADKGVAEIRHALLPALDEDLLQYAGSLLRFPHDRVLEAAYSLVDETERAAMHLRIGRLLLVRALADDRLEDELFDVVGQLNRGAPQLEEERERIELAELNLRAARKARASAAFSAAIAYSDAGLRLLHAEAWTTHHKLAFELQLGSAICAFGAGRIDDAAARVAVARAHARGRHELTDVSCLEIDLFTYRSDIARSIEVALVCLRQFGIDWPLHPERKAVDIAFAELEALLGDRSIEDLLALPRMEDPDALAVTRLLTTLADTALYVDLNLLALAVCHQTSLSIRHGNADSSVLGYAALSMAMGPVFGRYDQAPAWGELARALVDQRELAAYKGKIYFMLMFSRQWSKHLDGNQEILAQALDGCLDAGDLKYACYAHLHSIALKLVLGVPLPDVLRATEESLAFLRRVGGGLIESGIVFQQRLVLNLMGRTTHFSTYSDATFEQQRFEAELAANTTVPVTAQVMYRLWKLEARYLSGDYDEAVRAASEAEPLLWVCPSFIEISEFHSFHALALAARHDTAAPGEQAATRTKLTSTVALFAQWAALCPENFLGRHALLGAELARIEGRSEDAAHGYEAAIRASRQHGWIHHLAIAFEAASHFHRARGFELIADTYVREARACYLRWGAEGKVAQLDRKHPHLFERHHRGPSATLTVSTDQLDLLSIVKASQSISSVTDRDLLLRRLLEVVLEQGGAHSARLVFVRDGRLTLEAEAALVERGIDTALNSRPVDATSPVAETVLQYVRRTGLRVSLEDAANDAKGFAHDPYLQRARPCALLCLPILRQGEPIAVLHLENALVPGAFTDDRLVALELIASQAAISLENALLLGRERAARSEAEAARERAEQLFEERQRAAADARFVADVSKALAESIDYRATLARLAELAVPYLADWCIVDVAEGPLIRRVAGAHVDPEGEALLRGFEQRTWSLEDARHPAAQAVATGQTHIATHVGDDASIGGLGATSVIAAPLVAHGRVLGAMTFAFARPGRVHGPGTVALAEEIARRAALALDNARLFRDAQESIRVRDEFLSIASHELRTPVTSLLLSAQGLLRNGERASFEQLRRGVQLIERQASRLGTLINDMLGVGRIHLEQLDVTLGPVDLVATTRDVLDQLSPVCVNAGCVVTFEAPATLVGRWDAQLLGHVVTNLLANALKFGAGKPVVVRIEEEGRRAVLRVIDQGIGIAPDALPHIFERFFRAVSTRSYGGFGLGLYIVRHMVEVLGGAVHAASAPGRGTTLTVELPLDGPGQA